MFTFENTKIQTSDPQFLAHLVCGKGKQYFYVIPWGRFNEK